MTSDVVARCVLGFLAFCGCAPSSAVADAGRSQAAVAIRDPSFEGSQPNPQGKALGSPWNLAASCTGRFGPIYPSFGTGTGFMPTDGTQYARFDDKGCGPTGSRTLAINQLNENLGGARRLTFDYEMKATIPAGCQGASAQIQLLFTGNGTQVLWTSPTFATAGDVQQRAQSVVLPSLPSLPDPTACTGACNMLTIQMTTSGGCTGGDGGGSLNDCPCGEFLFSIDNLRVE